MTTVAPGDSGGAQAGGGVRPPQVAGSPDSGSGAPPSASADPTKPPCNCHCECVPIGGGGATAYVDDSWYDFSWLWPDVADIPERPLDDHVSLDAGPPYAEVAGITREDLIVTSDGLIGGEAILVDQPAGLEYGSPAPGVVPRPPEEEDRLPAGTLDLTDAPFDVQTAGLVSAPLRDELGSLTTGLSTAGGGLPSASAGGTGGAGPGAAVGRSDLARYGRPGLRFEAPALPTLDASVSPPSDAPPTSPRPRSGLGTLR